MRHYAQMYGVNARLGKCGPGGILSPDTPTPPGSLGHSVNPERVPCSGFIFMAGTITVLTAAQTCIALFAGGLPSCRKLSSRPRGGNARAPHGCDTTGFWRSCHGRQIHQQVRASASALP